MIKNFDEFISESEIGKDGIILVKSKEYHGDFFLFAFYLKWSRPVGNTVMVKLDVSNAMQLHIRAGKLTYKKVHLSKDELIKVVGLSNEDSIALNNQKTPFWKITHHMTNMEQLLHDSDTVESITSLKDIQFN